MAFGGREALIIPITFGIAPPVAAATPAFVADCLETLEEIAMEANEQFLHHGGEEFMAVPCLNDEDEWCGVVANWIKDFKKE